MPTKAICDVVHAHGALSVVDAITALGVIDLPMDAWGIDVLITGSQKALMLPPGLACIALSKKAWDAAAKSALPKFYFNLVKERESQAGGQTAWTTAVPLVRGLELALQMMQKETLPELFKRHAKLAEATRAGVKALGLELLAPDAPSTAVTAIKVPAEIKDGKAIPKTLRDRFGVTITGGQDELEGKIFRLTHLGYVDQFDVLTGLSALELALPSLGYTKAKMGAATTAALEVFAR
jgi:aspartate aminotransferase-like enzyme